MMSHEMIKGQTDIANQNVNFITSLKRICRNLEDGQVEDFPERHDPLEFAMMELVG